MHAPHWPRQMDERVEDVQARSGHSAARGFLGREPPAAGNLVRVLVAEMAFEVQDLPELAALDRAPECLHRGPQAPVVPDAEHHAGARARAYHDLRVDFGQRERLFAEDVLARERARDDLLAMQRMRRDEDKRLHCGIGERFCEIGRGLEAVPRGKTARDVGHGVHAAHEADSAAPALYRFEKTFSPPAEAHDGGVDHARPYASMSADGTPDGMSARLTRAGCPLPSLRATIWRFRF